MIWTYILAVWGTIALVVLFAAGTVATELETEALGMALSILGFLPTIIGLGLGIASFDRRLGNPSAVWIGTIWNIVNLAVWLLLIIAGLFMT